MHNGIETRIIRAKELLRTARHAAMATVNSDGSPHNTPYLFMRSENLEFLFWGSDTGSVHSQNILRTGQLFVVLYDLMERGGLYIRAEAGRVANGAELEDALLAHNTIRRKEGKELLDTAYYTSIPTRKLWIAQTTNFWINTSERDDKGRLLKDGRIEITRGELLV